jgi:leucyl/phenylalanyl-tRNA--protein transferase
MLLRISAGEIGRLFSEGIEPEPAPPPAARRLRREAAFRENLAIKTRRFLRVIARLARPRRVVDLPAAIDLLFRERRFKSGHLPDPRGALPAADGFAGFAHNLTPGSMMEAYGRGLSPSASLGPVAWHCRPTRLVAQPADIARAFDAPIAGAERGWIVAFDRDGDSVLALSGRPPDRSAIMPARLLSGFAELFDAGFAHSFELRDEQGQTIGGGFGVAVGGVFILEGAFETVAGAARLGLSHLAGRLRDWNFCAVECAPGVAWLAADVFSPIPREEFLALVALHMGEEKVGRWSHEDAVKILPAADGQRLAA